MFTSVEVDEMADKPSKWEYVLRGMPLPHRVLDDNLQGVLHLEVREDDVFVVSYPKSGTNWVRSIINCILKSPQREQTNMSLPIEMNMSTGIARQEVEAAPSVFKIVQAWTSPRVMFTHLVPRLLPTEIDAKGAKIVYICRNPKDVANSYHYFRQTLRTKVKETSLNTFLEDFIQGEVPYGSYFAHVKQYWQIRDKPNLLFLKFEDLKKDDCAVISEIAAFLGRNLAAAEIEDISKQCSIPNMRSAFKMASQTMSVIIDQSKGDFVRQGKVGSWKETFSEAQSQRFDTLTRDHLAGTGLTFELE